MNHRRLIDRSAPVGVLTTGVADPMPAALTFVVDHTKVYEVVSTTIGGTSAPSSGTWRQGDLVHHYREPAPGDHGRCAWKAVRSAPGALSAR